MHPVKMQLLAQGIGPHLYCTVLYCMDDHPKYGEEHMKKSVKAWLKILSLSLQRPGKRSSLVADIPPKKRISAWNIQYCSSLFLSLPVLPFSRIGPLMMCPHVRRSAAACWDGVADAVDLRIVPVHRHERVGKRQHPPSSCICLQDG